jgi:hypothetical protein
MLLRSETAGRTAALLTIKSEQGMWAFPSAAVLSVEPLAVRADEQLPLDLASLLGSAASEPGEDTRVLVLAGKEQRRVRVSGTLRLVDGASLQLLPLPPELCAVSPLLSHMALIDGKPSLFVVSPERLLESLERASLPPDAPSRPPR